MKSFSLCSFLHPAQLHAAHVCLFYQVGLRIQPCGHSRHRVLLYTQVTHSGYPHVEDRVRRLRASLSDLGPSVDLSPGSDPARLRPRADHPQLDDQPAEGGETNSPAAHLTRMKWVFLVCVCECVCVCCDTKRTKAEGYSSLYVPYYNQPTETSAWRRARGSPVASIFSVSTTTTKNELSYFHHIYILLYLKEEKVHVLFLYGVPQKKNPAKWRTAVFKQMWKTAPASRNRKDGVTGTILFFIFLAIFYFFSTLSLL